MILTNYGGRILNKMTVTHPAAKMLVELAKSQVQQTAYSTRCNSPTTGAEKPRCLQQSNTVEPSQ